MTSETTTTTTLPAWMQRAHEQLAARERERLEAQERERLDKAHQARAALEEALAACLPGWQERLELDFVPDGHTEVWWHYSAPPPILTEPTTGLSVGVQATRGTSNLAAYWPLSERRYAAGLEHAASKVHPDKIAEENWTRLGQLFYQAHEHQQATAARQHEPSAGGYRLCSCGSGLVADSNGFCDHCLPF